MHLLPCPHCNTEIPVTPSRAGESIPCPQCGETIEIPNLGQLRQFPRYEGEASESAANATRGPAVSPGRSAAFLLLALTAAASLLIAAFCGIRWSLIEVTGTTEEHVATVRVEYAKASAAQLIREFEDMENHPLELSLPYQYKQIENKRRDWGRNASVAGAIGGIALVGAVVVAASGRRRSRG